MFISCFKRGELGTCFLFPLLKLYCTQALIAPALEQNPRRAETLLRTSLHFSAPPEDNDPRKRDNWAVRKGKGKEGALLCCPVLVTIRCHSLLDMILRVRMDGARLVQGTHVVACCGISGRGTLYLFGPRGVRWASHPPNTPLPGYCVPKHPYTRHGYYVA